MADGERVRIEIGFEGAQGMAVLLEVEAADALEQAFADGGVRTFAVDTEDGRYALRLDRVVYVKRFSRESRVGFGA